LYGQRQKQADYDSADISRQKNQRFHIPSTEPVGYMRLDGACVDQSPSLCETPQGDGDPPFFAWEFLGRKDQGQDQKQATCHSQEIQLQMDVCHKRLS